MFAGVCCWPELAFDDDWQLNVHEINQIIPFRLIKKK